MDRAGKIEWAKELSNWIIGHLPEEPLDGGFRTRLVGGCFNVSLHHYMAIIALLDRELDASALALSRPQVEAYFMGSFLNLCASDDEIQNYAAGRTPTAATLVKRLEKPESMGVGVIGRFKQENWKLLSEFTHTGIGLIAYTTSESEIGTPVSGPAIIQLLGASSAWALLAACGIAAVADNSALAATLLDRAEQLAKGL